MERFLPEYIGQDALSELPTEKSFEYDILNLDFFSYKIDWTDITYDEPTLDIQDIKIEFEANYGRQLIKIDFPAIKEWEIDAY